MELSKIIDSQVSSGLTEKRYRTNINEINPEDNKQQSELYEINVFGHILHIAPGLTIKDKEYPKLVYCYIYAILKNKVKAKLGIVEELTDSPPEIFDISLIEDGRLRLFDVYEQNPDLIRELEYVGNAETEKSMREQREKPAGYEKMNINIFEYIKSIITSKINGKPGHDEIKLELKNDDKKGEYPSYHKILKGILSIYTKILVEKKAYITKEVVDEIKIHAKDMNSLCAILVILEIGIKKFNIIVLDNNDTVVKEINYYRKFTNTPINKDLEYLIVKFTEDNEPILIEKYSSYEVLSENYKTEKSQKERSQKPKKSSVEVPVMSESKMAEEPKKKESKVFSKLPFSQINEDTSQEVDEEKKSSILSQHREKIKSQKPIPVEIPKESVKPPKESVKPPKEKSAPKQPEIIEELEEGEYVDSPEDIPEKPKEPSKAPPKKISISGIKMNNKLASARSSTNK